MGKEVIYMIPLLVIPFSNINLVDLGEMVKQILAEIILSR